MSQSGGQGRIGYMEIGANAGSEALSGGMAQQLTLGLALLARMQRTCTLARAGHVRAVATAKGRRACRF